MNPRSTQWQRSADVHMDRARTVYEWMKRNPARYDTPNTRRILATHIRNARHCNRAAIRCRKAGR